MPVDQQRPHGPIGVPYNDLSGGLNTKKDPHALGRNQLAQSINCWYATGNSLSKRPGSAAIITANGASGLSGLPIGLSSARYSNVTNLILQQGSNLAVAAIGAASWTSLGTLGAAAKPITTAQMYDPETSKTLTFIADGVDTPKTWDGAVTLGTVITTGTHCPYNHTNAAPITPRYVATNGYYLFYSGEPTEPSAVYISRPSKPQTFDISSTSDSTVYANPYIPYFIGWNDGVQGGDITGMAQLGRSMLIFKQSAIYRMDQVGLLGQMAWGSSVVSASVGCLSPRSIVQFDNYVCFLGIDGVYMTDGNSTKRLSDDIPTYFDGSLLGIKAQIVDRTTAVAVRSGQRYLIYFDSSGVGYADKGLWFDFAKPTESGLPATGEIQGMKVAGVAPLRGPGDDGNFVWCDPTVDRTGKFGIGYADFTSNIQMTFYGKSDQFSDVFGPEAPVQLKTAQRLFGIFSTPGSATQQSYTVTAFVVTDLLQSTQQTGTAISPIGAAGTWGQNWGTMVWSSSISQSQYQVVEMDAQSTAQGKVLQIGFQESSQNPLTFLGYQVYLNSQEVSQ